MISEQEQRSIMDGALNLFRSLTPIDTGNLRNNATQLENLGNGKWRIIVDGEPPDVGVAPYMPYTNEPWVDPRWNGKKNPNEGWFERATDRVAAYIAMRVRGGLKRS